MEQSPFQADTRRVRPPQSQGAGRDASLSNPHTEQNAGAVSNRSWERYTIVSARALEKFTAGLTAELQDDFRKSVLSLDYTVKEYLQKRGEIHEPSLECNFSTLCLRYLTFPGFRQNENSDENALRQQAIAGDPGFQDYAVANWYKFTMTAFVSTTDVSVHTTGTSVIGFVKEKLAEFSVALRKFISEYAEDWFQEKMDGGCSAFRDMLFREDPIPLSNYIRQHERYTGLLEHLMAIKDLKGTFRNVFKEHDTSVKAVAIMPPPPPGKPFTAGVTPAQHEILKDLNQSTKKSILSAFSDSGYASAPTNTLAEQQSERPVADSVLAPSVRYESLEECVGNETENDLNFNDSRSIYSDAASATTWMKEHYVADLVKDLTQNVLEGRTAKDFPLSQLCEHLPGLLKAFARTIGHLQGFPQSRDVMVFVSKHRDLIVAKLRASLEPVMATSEKVAWWFEEESSIDMHFDRRPAENPGRKPCEHDLQLPEYYRPSSPSDSTKPGYGDVNEAEDEDFGNLMPPGEDGEEHEVALPSYREYVTVSPAYLWLKSRIRRNIAVSIPSPNVMRSIADAISSGLSRATEARMLSRSTKPHTFVVEFSLNWLPVEFIQEQGYSDPPEDVLGKIITLTGTVSDAQALTVEEYIQYMWPLTGIGVLESVKDAIRQHIGAKRVLEEYKLYHGAVVRSTLSDTAVYISARGTLDAVAEIGEQLAWMMAAIRSSGDNTGLTYCSPLVRTLETGAASNNDQTTATCYIDFVLEMHHEQKTSSGQCWHALFRNAVIAKGFPVRVKANENIGMEIPLNVLAALVRTHRIQEFGGNFFIKTFSALLVLTKYAADVVVWHLLYNQDGEHLSYTSPQVAAAISTVPQPVQIHSLQSARHVVGWCSKVSCFAGSPSASDQIDRSDLPNTHQRCVLEKVTITGGQFITAGASFVIGKKDNPVFLRPRDDYFEQLSWISKKFVIFHDIKDRRAWMVDGASALLHLVRASLQHNQDDDFSHLFLFDPKHLVEAPPDLVGRKAAIGVLANEKNLDIKLRQKAVETSEEETIRADGVIERTTKRKVTYYTFKDRVDQICHFMEQIMAHQSQVLSQDGVGFKIKGSARRQLEGFDFKDIAESRDPLRPRVATLESTGVGWVDFTRAMHAITLFGRGFGELFKPSSGVRICNHWKAVPKAMDYLTVRVSDLQEILETRGSTGTLSNLDDSQRAKGSASETHWKLVDDIHWLNPGTIFGPCRASRKPKGQKCCERAQVLLPTSVPRFWAKYNSPTAQDLRVAHSGAIIFGHNRKLSLRWPDIGDPEDGNSEDCDTVASSSSLSLTPTDSGIGSSIGSAQLSSQYSLGSQTTDNTYGRKKRGNPFRISRTKKQKRNG